MLKYPIEVPQFDASSLTTAMRCLRKYFYEYILCWRPDLPKHDLTFGEAYHEGHAVLLLLKDDPQVLTKAVSAFLEVYRRDFPPETDQGYEPKTPSAASVAYMQYQSFYKSDKDEWTVRCLEDGTPMVEIGGRMPINEEGRTMSFRLDKVLDHRSGKTWFWDIKTTKYMNQNIADSYALNFQMLTYNHALRCLLEPERVGGGLVDTTIFLKTKIDFLRVPVTPDLDRMKNWLVIANFWCDQIEAEVEALNLVDSEAKPSSVQISFPLNTTSCFDYNKACPYLPLCLAWGRPCDQEMPPGFKYDKWNPLDHEVKTIVNLNIPKGE